VHHPPPSKRKKMLRRLIKHKIFKTLIPSTWLRQKIGGIAPDKSVGAFFRPPFGSSFFAGGGRVDLQYREECALSV